MKETARKSTGAADDGGTACGVCRICLRPCGSARCPLFSTLCLQPAAATVCIGERLAQLAEVKMSPGDGYPQSICMRCLAMFKETHLLLCTARRSDRTLRARLLHRADPRLPEPIRFDPTAVGAAAAESGARRRVDKRVAAVVDTTKLTEEVKIKEEVMSEDEAGEPPEQQLDVMPELDIKIEPEELVAQYRTAGRPNCTEEKSPPPLSNFIITNTFSMGHEQHAAAGAEMDQSLKMVVKEELDEDIDSDVPLDCMLCPKVFQTVSGLKAHVITSHSYKSVLRKRLNGSVTDVKVGAAESKVDMRPEQLTCFACSKAFSTAESLRLHEAVHDTACKRCGECFSTFVLRARHASACTAPPTPAPTHAPAPAAGRRTRTVRQLKREYTAEPSQRQNIKKKKTTAKLFNSNKFLYQLNKESPKRNGKKPTNKSKKTIRIEIKTKGNDSKKPFENKSKVENVQALSQITNLNVKNKNEPDFPKILPSELVDTNTVISMQSPETDTRKDDATGKNQNGPDFPINLPSEATDTNPVLLQSPDANINIDDATVKKKNGPDFSNNVRREAMAVVVSMQSSDSKIDEDDSSTFQAKNVTSIDGTSSIDDIGSSCQNENHQTADDLSVTAKVEHTEDIDDPVKILDDSVEKVSDNVKPTDLVDVDVKNNALLASSARITKDNGRLFITLDPVPVISALSNQVIGDV